MKPGLIDCLPIEPLDSGKVACPLSLCNHKLLLEWTFLHTPYVPIAHRMRPADAFALKYSSWHRPKDKVLTEPVVVPVFGHPSIQSFIRVYLREVSLTLSVLGNSGVIRKEHHREDPLPR